MTDSPVTPGCLVGVTADDASALVMWVSVGDIGRSYALFVSADVMPARFASCRSNWTHVLWDPAVQLASEHGKAVLTTEERGMKQTQFNKLAKLLKLPSAGRLRDEKWFWEKRGGYAGQKTIDRVSRAARDALWVRTHSSSGGNADGSVTDRMIAYRSPEGHVLAMSASYGATKDHNRFSIGLVMWMEGRA